MNFSIDSGDQISPAPQESSPAFVSHLMSMADSISSIVPSGFGSFGGNRVSGKEVFFCSDVQLYFISPPEEQRTISPLPFQLVTLRIVMLNPNNQVGGQPPAYIDAESWFYPLIPLQSPVLRTTQGHYIFPDVTSNASGGSVGIILPSSVTPEIRHTFETLLLTLCGLTNFPSEETTNISELFRRDANSTTMNIVTTITDGMVAVAEIASEGISEGTTKTVQLLSEGVNYEKMQLPQSVDPVIIPPAVKETVESVMEYTGKVVALSSVVVSKVEEATAILTTYLASCVQSSATSTLSVLSGKSELESAQCVNKVLEVTGSVMNGIGTIYSGLRQSGKVLVDAIANNTVQLVEHCYGPEAGEIADKAATAVTNVTTLGLLHSTTIEPDKVASRVAKDTGKALLNQTPATFNPQDNERQ